MEKRERIGQGDTVRKVIVGSDIEQAVAEGRMSTLQIKRSELLAYQSAALDSGSTIEIIAKKEGKGYPARKRFTGILEMDGESPKFYKWQIGRSKVRKNHVAIIIKNPKGEPGLLQFWLNLYQQKQTQQASVKVQKTPVLQ